MAEKYKFTNEAKAVFNYIKTDVADKFPARLIGGRHYIYSVLCNKSSIAHRTLEKILVSENISAMEEACYSDLMNASDASAPLKYDPVYDKCLSECGSNGNVIDSCSFLISLIGKDKDTARFFSKFGVSAAELNENRYEESQDQAIEKPVERKRKKAQRTKEGQKATSPIKRAYDNTEVEKHLVNLSKMADEGKIDEALDSDAVIGKIFSTLLKRDRNNVLLVGEPGSGKTCTVEHIANLISNGNVPKYFMDKRLMRMDFLSLISGTGFRGGFESKYQGIVDTASRIGKYIFFIDDIHSILSPNSKFSEVSTDVMLEEILNDKNIMFIATTTFEGYSKLVAPNKALMRRFEKITLEEKKGEELIKILTKVAEKYEAYHDVKFGPDAIEKAIELSERFLGGSNIYTVADVLDTAAANELIKHGKDKKMEKLLSELDEINTQLEEFNRSTASYDVYDDICRKQIEKKSEINRYEKEMNLNKKVIQVQMESLYKAVSEKTNIPVGTVGTTEKEKLKHMDSIIKKKVVGQDDAVNTVCRSVRRHRVGLGNPDKPSVFLFTGTSGVGKTLLAKKLSEEVFGSDKIVRLDMSEYSDKISTTKLTGSSAGYIGYEEGGILTEAIKKNNHCVLLLDEIEKANEEVFNVFLQVFDEGRLTDNKGVTVDFRNVIIIMTSNIGTREASEYKGLIGFGDRGDEYTKKDVIMKVMKEKLPPEFINRIDEIVFFNKLTDGNLKDIIKIEIGKVEDRVRRIGYSFDKSITDGPILESIFNEVKKESEYGARPVLREIQRQLEDKLTDFLLDNKVKKGYAFKAEDIYITKD